MKPKKTNKAKSPVEKPVAVLSVELGGMTEVEKTAFCIWLIKQARFIDETPAHLFAKIYRARMFRR